MMDIIIEHVDMPPLKDRRYQKEFKNNRWSVLDTENNTTRYRGPYEDVSIACHNLNKGHYKNISTCTNTK